MNFEQIFYAHYSAHFAPQPNASLQVLQGRPGVAMLVWLHLLLSFFLSSFF
jgi:hypothetical protein